MREWKKLTWRKRWARAKHAVLDFFGQYGWPRKTVGHAWYWLRTHTYNRYHIVDCRSPQNGYKWGWIDRDNLMYNACFNILVDFVEKEMIPGPVDWDHNEDARKWRDEYLALYNWWKTGRAEERKKARAEQRGAGFDRYAAIRKQLDDRDEEMLQRLLKVREGMWT
jgi:hypothetical protein